MLPKIILPPQGFDSQLAQFSKSCLLTGFFEILSIL